MLRCPSLSLWPDVFEQKSMIPHRADLHRGDLHNGEGMVVAMLPLADPICRHVHS